ncbi:MAG: hypothetical protein KJO18_11190, partial [Acidimicrobiia bacterium]|nr:hypothetical protein [Acidimicrobiia bacterium]
MNQLLVKVLAIAMLSAACTGATVKETTSLPSAPPSTPVSVQSTPVPPPTTTSTPTTTTASTTTAAPQAATVDPLLDRWIAVLASLPIDEYTEQEAAREAETFGIGDTNVLLSNEYGSLNGGYWVVYSGVFDQSLWAWDRCAELGGDCYARYLGGDPTVPPLLSEGQLWIWLEGRLVAVSAEDGQIVRTITTGWADGQFAGPLQIAADRVTGYFALGYEDSWFGCDATLGQFVEVDLVTGDTQLDHDGIMPTVSPDGEQLAYLAADECLEDPDEPQFYIAYHDEVVVRDLASGTERSWGPASGIAPDVSVVQH